ncbi:MAG TPA: 30S ribosomal protein S8, partial [Blastocatellia bacterium]|nr:30S ribosomal protein S8 [Blastocatellia bacterium]
MTDPVADMLTRIRNAYSAKHQKVDVPISRTKLEIARILKEEGFINNYKVIGDGVRRNIRVYLRYGAKGELVVSKIERVSKPGC